MIAQLGDCAAHAAAVEFMIAGDVKDRLVNAGRPAYGLGGAADVAGKYDNVSVIFRQRQPRVAQMQVRQDIEPN